MRVRIAVPICLIVIGCMVIALGWPARAFLNGFNPLVGIGTKPSGGGGTGIACAIGPSYTGTVPAAASRAGFSTCAANYDFTQTASFTDSLGTHTWSTLSTWLSCAGATSTLIWYCYHSVPVGDFAVQADGAITQVLKTTFTATDYANNLVVSAITSMCGDNCATGTLFPLGMYIEFVFRVDATGLANAPVRSGGNGGLWDFYNIGESPVNFTNISSGWMPEIDWIETYKPISGQFTGSVWGPSPCGSRCFPLGAQLSFGSAATDYTIYHTYSARLTLDASGNTGSCIYLDGTLQSTCTAGIIGNTSGITSAGIQQVIQSRTGLLITVGPGIAAGTNTCGGGTASCSPGAPQIGFLQRATVWTCSTWQNSGAGSGCTGTVLTNAP